MVEELRASRERKVEEDEASAKAEAEGRLLAEARRAAAEAKEEEARAAAEEHAARIAAQKARLEEKMLKCEGAHFGTRWLGELCG